MGPAAPTAFLFAAGLAVLPAQANAHSGAGELIRERQPALEAFYRDLHENPELSGEESRTAGKVAAEFRSLGLEATENIGGSGVVGILRNGAGPTTLLRSELDALPISEATGLPYKSRIPGKMHACGHDFHTTLLAGAAYVMAKRKDLWRGTIVFLAQPAEEKVAGAKAMIDNGLFKKIPRPDQFLALHTSGLYKKGAVAITPGFVMASGDSIDIAFRGKGTHGSAPHRGVDPFMQAAEFILKTQTLVGRERDPLEPGLVSVGSVHGGTKHNIIPDEVKVQLTVRAYDAELRAKLKRRLAEVAKGIAATNGAAEPLISYSDATDPTYNDPRLAARIAGVIRSELGADAVLEPKGVMGSEDFGQFGVAIGAPSLFVFLGERNEREPSIGNHSALFAPDFSITAPIGIRAMTAALFDLHR